MAVTMRITLDVPTRVAQELLGYITDSSPESELVVTVRLVQRRGRPQPPHIVWEVELLPSNGGIYRMLLERGANEKGIHYYQGE